MQNLTRRWRRTCREATEDYSPERTLSALGYDLQPAAAGALGDPWALVVKEYLRLVWEPICLVAFPDFLATVPT